MTTHNSSRTLSRRRRLPGTRLFIPLLVLFAAGPAHGDIYSWFFQPIPGTAGIALGPGVDVSNWNTSGHNLEYAFFHAGQDPAAIVDLTGANFANSDVNNAWFNALLTNANFTGATINNALFYPASGFTAAQLASTASFAQRDLTGVRLFQTDLTGVNFANFNLSSATFNGTKLAQANFSGATINWATFNNGSVWSGPSGLAPDQLYSTASYAHRDLTHVQFWYSSLAGWNFAGQDLIGASFNYLTFTGANLAGAVINGTSFTNLRGFTAGQIYATASYARRDLRGTTFFQDDLTGWSFAHQDLTGASFLLSTLTNVDFTGAAIKGAVLRSVGFTEGQLYSTASYVRRDLGAIDMDQMNYLAGWNFAQQNLRRANFNASNLSGANFTGANIDYGWFDSTNLTNARFAGAVLTNVNFRNANLANADLSGADIRGAGFDNANLTHANLAGANLTDVRFHGANLANADFRDADLRGAADWSPAAGTITSNTVLPDGSLPGLSLAAGETLIIRNHPIAITVSAQADAVRGSALEFLLEFGWTSTMQFAPGLKPRLKGTLDLEIAPGTDPASLVGESFDLFDWNGHMPFGQGFSSIITEPGLVWDLSKLYKTGTVTLLAAFDQAAASVPTSESVPEPASLAILFLGATALLTRRRRA